MQLFLSLVFIVAFSSWSIVFGHKVDTHQSITTTAVQYLQGQDSRFSCAANLTSTLRIGTGGEDEESTWRPFFHFSPHLDDYVWSNLLLTPFQVNSTCSSTEWAFSNQGCSTFTGPLPIVLFATNEHNWQAALDKARGSSSTDLAGWQELGYVLHLLEDLSSPAHARNDAHPDAGAPFFVLPDIDPVEFYEGSAISPANGTGLISYATPQDYFVQLQHWTESNFFSKDTCFDPSLAGPPSNSNDQDDLYFYDARYIGRKIAYKGLRFRYSSGLRRAATIDETIAREQFHELAPQAVLYAASFLKFYYDVASPNLCDEGLSVTNVNDSGPGSLRQAILNANNKSGTDTISFNIRGTPPYTIIPLSPLPDITDPVIIDGATQPGFSGQPVIELNGSRAQSSRGGLRISGGNSQVRGLVINGFSPVGAIILSNRGQNTIQGNYLGTDVSGTVAQRNGAGVIILSGADNNIIRGNLISGNGVGVDSFFANNNVIDGNLIGVDISGTRRLSNDGGIIFFGSSGNTVGGSTLGARNIISGSITAGIEMINSANEERIQGNYIGTDVTGSVSLGNSSQGILIYDGSNILIGGSTAGERNIISGNGYGIAVEPAFNLSVATGIEISGNYIGTDASGLIPLGNERDGILFRDSVTNSKIGGPLASQGNIISANRHFGILLQGSLSDNLIQSNIVGLDVAGKTALLNVGGAAVVCDFRVTNSNVQIGNNLISSDILFFVGGVGSTIVNNSEVPDCSGGIKVFQPQQSQILVTENGNVGFMPEAPQGVHMTGLTNAAATLNWSNVGEADRYEVFLNSTSINFVSAPQLSYMFTGLNANTTYFASLRALNSRCTGSFSGLQFTTTP